MVVVAIAVMSCECWLFSTLMCFWLTTFNTYQYFLYKASLNKASSSNLKRIVGGPFDQLDLMCPRL